MRAALLAAAAILLPLSGYALETPKPSPADPHIKTAVYDPMDQVLLVGTVGRSSTITFGADEHITRVVLEMAHIGPDGKEVPPPWTPPETQQLNGNPLGNVLPLWPAHAGRSSAQVVTKTADGTQRVYQFALVAVAPNEDCGKDDCDDARVTYGLKFTYPTEEKKAKAAAQAVAWKARHEQDLKDRVKTDIFYGVRNWRYVGQGTKRAKALLAPDEISDNGAVTAFLYLGNRRVPSIYVCTAEPCTEKDERQVTPVPQQDLLIVQETARHWRLRFGENHDAVLDVWNEGYDPVGANPETGTTSPDVIRVVRKEAK